MTYPISEEPSPRHCPGCWHAALHTDVDRYMHEIHPCYPGCHQTSVGDTGGQKRRNTMMYTTDEIEAAAGVAHAITLGMAGATSNVELDRSLPPADEAAMKRLRQLLDALTAVYPDAMEWHFDSYIRGYIAGIGASS